MWTEQEVAKVVQENTGLVASLVNRAMRLYPRLPSGYDRDDIHSLGNMGLLSAARTFDPERGVAFSTYAYRCIGHSIVGALKREWNQQIECVSLSQMFGEDEDSPLEDQIADKAPDPMNFHCDREPLEMAMAGLPEREAQVIRLLYFEGDSVLQVAQRWRLSAQAVQTVHLRALKALRLRLRRLGIQQWDH